MSSVNKVILVGHLGRDPETRTFPSGDQVCNVSIATTDKWKDKQSGEQRESTEWHRLQFNGRLAEIAAQYLRKGSQIYVEGKIQTRKYNDKDGVEKYATDIRVDNMQMLGSPRDDDGGGQRGGDRGGQRQDDRGQQRSNDRGGDQRQQPQQRSQDTGGGRNSYAENRGGSAPRQQQGRPAASGQGTGGGYGQREGVKPGSSGFDDMDDDIPFITSSYEVDVSPSKSKRLRRASFQ